MPFILNETEISLVQIHHWYMISLEINENSEKKYIDQVFKCYPSPTNRFTPTRIQILEEEIKSKGYPNASKIKIIAISYIGDGFKDEFFE